MDFDPNCGRRIPTAAGALIICFLLLLAACQSRVNVSSATSGASPEKVLVLSFQNMAERFSGLSAVRSPLTGKVFPLGRVMEGAETLLLQEVIGFLAQSGRHAVVPPGRAQGELSRLSIQEADLAPDREMIVRLGSALEVDAVVAGYVYRFEDRQGTAYGVNRPASVAFELHLIQIPNGRLLWSAAVDETQQSLSEDLLQFEKFIERKGRWVTAPDMARAALQKAFDRFP